MENKKYRKSIIDAYSNLVSNTMADMSSVEEIIIESPNIRTVQDGSKAIYANECRRLIALLLNKYYFTENLNKWNEFKELLKLRIENELNYDEKGVTIERVYKNWATNAVLKNMNYAESELCEEIEENDFYDKEAVNDG